MKLWDKGAKLENKDVESLINLAQNHDEEAMETLIRMFTPKVTAISRGYFLIGADYDDLIIEGMMGLYKAINIYDSNKNHNFGAFASLCINRQMQNAVKNANRKKNNPLNAYLPIKNYDGSKITDEENILKLVIADDSSNIEQNFIDKEFNAQIIEKVKGVLSEEQFIVLEMFLNAESYTNMAESMNMTVKQIDNMLQAIKKKLKQLRGEV